MKIEVYVLGLLKFKDDRIVFDDDELEIIAKRIGNCLGKCLGNETSLVGRPEEMGGYYVYPLEKCMNAELVLDKNKSKSVTIELARIGYYHHRVIMHFKLNSKSSLDFSTLRDVRKETVQIADLMIEKCIVNEIENLVSKNVIREEGKVEYCYKYPLIIVEKSKGKSKVIPFSEQTTSSCFDIIEPRRWLFTNKRHMMRISIPGTILYAQGTPGESLLRDTINAIYQYCLYEKKLKDGKGPFSNKLDESLLVNLWKHIIDTMGGRTPDVYTARIACTTLFLTILVIVLYIFTILDKAMPTWASRIILLVFGLFFVYFWWRSMNT